MTSKTLLAALVGTTLTLAPAALISHAAAQPANDNCSGATVISGLGTFSYNPTGATYSGPIFTGCAEMNNDVWFRWTAPQSGRVTLDTCASPNPWSMDVAAYEGSDCATLIPVACSDIINDCPTWHGEVSFYAVQGRTYTFRIDHGRAEPSSFSLSIDAPFPGDECEIAIPITGTGLFSFDTTGASTSFSNWNSAGYVGKDIFLRWQAPATGLTIVSNCGITDFQSIIAIFDDGCPVGEPIAANDDAPNCGTSSRVSFLATAGEHYLINIGSIWGGVGISGNFEILQDTTPTGGETITVTTLHDTFDTGGFQTVADLPGPDGKVSMREAVMAANNSAGPQTIEFAIPASEFWLLTDRAILRMEDGAFELTDNATTIDFTTQTDFTGDTNPDGWEVGIYGLQPNAWGVAAIFIHADNCVIKGLDRVMQRGYGVHIMGNNNRVIGCTISGPLHGGVRVAGLFGGTPEPTGNIIGGTEPGEGNTLSGGSWGVSVEGPVRDTTVIGNTMSGPGAGIRVVSAPGSNLFAVNTRIGGPTAAERNIISGSGRYGEEGFPQGAQVSLVSSIDTIVEGNYIGITPDGSARQPQRGIYGIQLSSAENTLIRGNVIGGIAITGTNHAAGQRFGTGIAVQGNSTDTVIENNLIGTDATGQSPIPSLVNLAVSPFIASELPVGVTIRNNTIAFAETIGVLITGNIQDALISRNSIFENGGLGIDLGGGGPNFIDPLDADTGPNGMQNFPSLAAAVIENGTTSITGDLHSTPNTTFTLEFFASAACDPSGFGEGRTWLGQAVATSDSGGNAPFNASVAVTTPGEWITATATSSAGATSEFSACITAIQGISCPADWDDSGGVDGDDIAAFFTDWQSGNADIDNSGGTDGDDITVFFNHWQSGC